MNIRKGPYGQFLTERIKDPGSIYGYAAEMTASGKQDHLLPVYPCSTVTGHELDIDISGLSDLETYMTSHEAGDVNVMRAAAGDLFSFIADMDDMLLPPEMIIWDKRYVFYDETTKKIKLLCLPLTERKCGSGSFEKYIRDSAFSKILTGDEISTVVYQFESGAYGDLKETAAKIRQSITTAKSNVRELIYSLLFAAGSLTSILLDMMIPALLFLTASLLLLYRSFRTGKKSEIRKESAGYDMKDILFDDAVSDEPCMILKEQNADADDPVKKAVYTDYAIIGSDLFLCDIVIPNRGLSCIHAAVKRERGIWYIKDISKDGAVYVEDRKLKKDIDYEIKEGQIITMGDTDLKVCIGYGK